MDDDICGMATSGKIDAEWRFRQQAIRGWFCHFRELAKRLSHGRRQYRR
jgi:hypothetical protein